MPAKVIKKEKLYLFWISINAKYYDSPRNLQTDMIRCTFSFYIESSMPANIYVLMYVCKITIPLLPKSIVIEANMSGECSQ